jgi:hypothetical protein
MNYLWRLKSWIKAKIRRITATTSKTAIAVLSAVIISFVVSVAVSKSVRFFSWEHPGILIVVIAVAGEVICDWNRKKTLKERLKKFFGIFLVAGLVLEITEAIQSDKKASQAILSAKLAETNAAGSYERAAIAEKEAGEANERAANTESNNLVLQVRIEMLQARRIEIDQEKKFIDFLKNCPKSPVKVFVGERDGETDDYAREIRQILDESGYGSGRTNDIIELGDARIASSIGIGQTVEDYPLVIEVYATNNDTKSIGLPGVIFTHDDATMKTSYFFDTNDVRAVMGLVDNAFQVINIYPALHGNNTYLKPGEWGIFIPKKF